MELAPPFRGRRGLGENPLLHRRWSYATQKIQANVVSPGGSGGSGGRAPAISVAYRTSEEVKVWKGETKNESRPDTHSPPSEGNSSNLRKLVLLQHFQSKYYKTSAINMSKL